MGAYITFYGKKLAHGYIPDPSLSGQASCLDLAPSAPPSSLPQSFDWTVTVDFICLVGMEMEWESKSKLLSQ